MSLIAETEGLCEAAPAGLQDRNLVDLRPMMIASAALCIFFIAVRIYEQVFALTTGVDSYDPIFQTYWVNILYAAEPIELIAFIGIVVYLWRTRDEDVANVAPREELRRSVFLLGWLFTYGLAIFWGFSFFSEQSAPAVQASLRDCAFTPCNIAQFYVSYPMFIIFGIGGFMYARTRLPVFACNGYSLAYVMFFFGPVMMLPSVALNEWGSSIWVMEELFVAPLHWTFVFFGWFTLGIFGVSLQLLGRITDLCEADENAGEILHVAKARLL